MSNSAKSLISIGIILILGLLIFLPRLDALPFRGEEPRRVVCAFEMLQSGNWFVPTIQNQVFLSRPPLQNWVIAATGVMRGTFDHLTGRLPSVLCALLTALLIYYYCLTALSRKTALLAAVFFLTMPQVLQLGITAETELMFTLFLSGSFLLWHRGELKNWPGVRKWGIAYLLLALATLTKGINQAPVYFAAIIGIHLLLNRRLKELVSVSHLSGFFLFILIVGIWQWGFVHNVGIKTGWLMHAGDVGLRFKDLGLKHYLEHGVVFPLELLAVMLPWSLFLLAYASRTFWADYLPVQAKPIAVFCISAIAITIVSVWYPPGARTRYYMPLFPCFAILAGIAAASIWEAFNQKKLSTWWGKFCPGLMRFWMILIPLAGIINFIWTIFDIHLIQPPEPIYNAMLYLIGCILLTAGLFVVRRTKNKFYLFVGCYAFFTALTMNFIYTDTRKEKFNDVETQVLSSLEKLPQDSSLVSIGAIPFDFLYYYMLHTSKTIPIVSEQELKLQTRPIYFCTRSSTPFVNKPSSEWKTMMEIATGRYKKGYTNIPAQSMVIAQLTEPRP